MLSVSAMEAIQNEQAVNSSVVKVLKELVALKRITITEIQDQVDRLEVMVICIGDIAFVGLPGEMFCEFGLKYIN